MRVFLAGASGAIGRRLIRLLLAAGHSVTGISRKDAGLAVISSLGAGARRCDALDREALLHCVESVHPDIVINQLTDLPQNMTPAGMKSAYEANNRIRREGSRNLLDAALAMGAKRFVTQSAAFWYSPYPAGPKDESAPFFTDAPEPIGAAAVVMSEAEGMVTSCSGLEGLAVRYGSLYGPGTWFARDGQAGLLLKKRLYPLIGNGEGRMSFIHVDDAASATMAVLEHGRAGEAYNVVDDEPAQMRDWLPALVQAFDAPPPLRLPLPIARLTLGRAMTDWLSTGPGALNAKIKTELGWQPQYASWRHGFMTL